MEQSFESQANFFVEVTWADAGPQLKVIGKPPVLLVEDSAVIARVFSLMLQKLGFAVHVAKNGREALDELKRENYAFVVMDCNMPVMSGLEATTLQRAIEEKSGGHVIIIGCSATCDQVTCLAAGMDGFLSKPTSLAEMQEQICALISKHRPC